MTSEPGAGSSPERWVLALVVDLMDRSRIQEAAPAGATVELFRRPDALWEALAAGVDARGDALVLVDLTRPGATDAVPGDLRQGATVIGFGPHVDDDLLERARAAGVHEVLPRSVFFRRLPMLLGGSGTGTDQI